MRQVPLLAAPTLAAATAIAAAAPAGAPACPKGHALAARTLELLHLTKDDLVDAHCAAGHFPAAGWALLVRQYEHGRADDPTAATGVSIRVAVADRAGAVAPAQGTVLFADLPVHVDDDDQILQLEAVDTDGDGTDELLYVQSTFGGGIQSRELHVLRYQGGAWTYVFDRMIAYDNTDSGDPKHVVCSASWRLVARHGQRAIELVPRGHPPRSEDCVTSRQLWAPDATGAFVQATK